MIVRLLPVLALAFPALAVAKTTHPAYTPPAVLSSANVLQIIFSLLLVLAVVVAIAWLLKRIGQPLQGTRQLKIVSGVAVGQRERVVVVEIGDTWLVLGVAPGNVRTLHTLPKNELPPSGSESGDADNKFQSWLKQMMEKRNAA